MKDKLINYLDIKYNKYGVTVEEIEYMVTAGLEYGLDPEIVRENADRQLADEYIGITEDDVFVRAVKKYDNTEEKFIQ